MATNQKTNSIHKRRRLVVASGLVLVAITLFIGLLGLYSKRLISIGQEKGEESSSVLGSASTLTSNGVLELRTGKLTTAASIPKVYEVDKGTKAVCIDIEVRNISGSEKLFIPLEEIKLSDKGDNLYDIAGVLTCAPGVGGPIQVGEVISGRLGFLVPDNSQQYKLLYLPLDKNTKSFIISNI